MKIPFSLPLIDSSVIAEVNDCLTNTGWLTSGPKVNLLEQEVCILTGVPACLCVNSWTSGAMLMLRWFGIGPGDEVIVPAYTYSATALCALNIGASVVMVDVQEDFTINPQALARAITPRTKAIIPVDLGGLPARYQELNKIVNSPAITSGFSPANSRQQKLGRPLLLSDAAHSLGALFQNRPAALQADATVFSFHSVKNITTGEGGAVALNLPPPFDNQEEFRFLKAFSLNGQTKSAFEKNQPGAWRYDIIDQGLKINMPDICAAVGLAQIRRYEGELLPDRRRVIARYMDYFSRMEWAILPLIEDETRKSSCHLFLLRIKNINEHQRDRIIQLVSDAGVGVNVHYIPMPMLTLFKRLGYRMEDYPDTYRLYENEITLPVYNGLSVEQQDFLMKEVVKAYESVCCSS